MGRLHQIMIMAVAVLVSLAISIYSGDGSMLVITVPIFVASFFVDLERTYPDDGFEDFADLEESRR